MDKFSEAYQKASDVVSGQKFEAAWDKLFKSPQFTQLLAADGPEEMQAAALDVLRKELSKDTKHGRLVASVMGGGVGDAIVAAATNKTSPGSLADRAATIKFLKHLYLAGKHGSQQVWCYAGTKSYGQWVFDEVQGTEGTIKSKVAHETEVYDAAARKAEVDAELEVVSTIVREDRCQLQLATGHAFMDPADRLAQLADELLRQAVLLEVEIEREPRVAGQRECGAQRRRLLVQAPIVGEDEFAVRASPPHVDLDHVGAEPHGLAQLLERVVAEARAVAAVRDVQVRGHGHSLRRAWSRSLRRNRIGTGSSQ